MVATTKSVYTQEDNYQLVARDKEMVRLQVDSGNKVRVHVGPELPAADTDDFFLVTRDIFFEGLDVGDNVYVRTEVIQETVRVVGWTTRGNAPVHETAEAPEVAAPVLRTPTGEKIDAPESLTTPVPTESEDAPEAQPDNAGEPAVAPETSETPVSTEGGHDQAQA